MGTSLLGRVLVNIESVVVRRAELTKPEPPRPRSIDHRMLRRPCLLAEPEWTRATQDDPLGHFRVARQAPRCYFLSAPLRRNASEFRVVSDSSALWGFELLRVILFARATRQSKLSIESWVVQGVGI